MLATEADSITEADPIPVHGTLLPTIQSNPPLVPYTPPPNNALMVPPMPPVIVVQSPTAPVPTHTPTISLRSPQTAFFMEFLGLIGLLGFGQMYAGRGLIGIALFVVWAIFYFGLLFFIWAGNAAAAALQQQNALSFSWWCLIIPALLACFVSGTSARDHIRAQQR
jgi:hypothetical protein